MIVTTLEILPGKTITHNFGLVTASTVRTKNIAKDFFASFKNILGGELTAYTELMNESRDEALKRLLEKASQMGANAVIGLRFSTSDVAPGAAEIMVYGTAVKCD